MKIMNSINNKFQYEIQKLIPNDINLKYNGEIYSKHQLVLSHLISDYSEAYLKSFDNEKKARTNTLESLGKGNEKRKKRYFKNKDILKNKKSTKREFLIALYENLILKRIIKGDLKFAYLLLNYLYLYQLQTTKLLNKIFLFNDKYKLVIDSLYEALKFFEFTYLVPSKIVNSCAICLNQYIKTYLPNITEEERLKFIRNIINIHFSKHAPATLRADYFNREIYCAGLYNGTPIFQWYAPADLSKSYYNKKDINKYFRMFTLLRKDLGVLNKVVTSEFVKKEHKEIVEEHFVDINKFKTIITSSSIAYVSNPNKLVKFFAENYKKTFKDYLKLPYQLIKTIFVALLSKLTLK
ncbi:MAG: hypothetical protein WCR78_11775 [Arcobacteraceae bacterium]